MSGPRWPPADLPHAQARAASFLPVREMRDADADGDRVLTLGELAAFVQRNTRREAARLGRDQSPVLVGNGGKAVMRW
jgi:hypothetical protein